MRLKLLSQAAPKANPIYNHRLHDIWKGMKQRCYNPKTNNYKDYGRRGIKVCDEWRDSYDLFYEWAINHGYADNLTIDRIDTDGNYEPNNCRWADDETQRLNTRRGKRYLWTIDGVTKHAREWCKHYGILPETAIYRVNIKGMTPKAALTTAKYQKV